MTPHVLPLIDASGADNVRPGWIPLIIVLLLGAFIAFLFFSMRKQLGKIDIPEDEPASTDDSDNGATPTASA